MNASYKRSKNLTVIE